MLIAPSILSADFSKLGEEILSVIDAGADWIHLDVMDGNFVRNLTFGAPIIKKIRPLTSKIFDVHLMISQPQNLLEDFIEAGADIITIHFEAVKPKSEILNIMKNVRKAGKQFGISIKPGTPLKKIEKYLKDVDLVLIMSVEPGWGGQKFMKKMLDKIRKLKKIRESDPSKYNYKIEIDGGINGKNVLDVYSAGCDVVVAGSFIFKSLNYENRIKMLKQATF